jgi:hypothetical protein
LQKLKKEKQTKDKDDSNQNKSIEDSTSDYKLTEEDEQEIERIVNWCMNHPSDCQNAITEAVKTYYEKKE